MGLQEAIDHAREVTTRENVCTSCREEHRQLADWLDELKSIREILGSYDLGRLRELVEADRDRRCAILPDVDGKAKKSVAEGLRDFFQEWAYEDRAVGLWGMTEEEKTVAEALLLALNGGRPC